MHVKVDTVDAMVVATLASPSAREAALQSIAAVDPGSEGVPMRQVRTTCHILGDVLASQGQPAIS